MSQDPSAALELVSVHKSEISSTGSAKLDPSPKPQMSVETEPDMQRATDLVDLHYGVKMNHMQGEDEGLKQARRDVDRVLEKLEGRSSRPPKR